LSAPPSIPRRKPKIFTQARAIKIEPRATSGSQLEIPITRMPHFRMIVPFPHISIRGDETRQQTKEVVFRLRGRLPSVLFQKLLRLHRGGAA
jgi:hypothetical protein